ncbi:MAG TPA: hypothetical protein VGR48_15940 [Terriglobales bacterium]|nr:hypothetical protein [Terriglobales bacterium]
MTQHNDVARTGQNLNETILSTSNVNVSNFGKLFWRTVDGYIYAQPLYVPNVNIGGNPHNVVYVATEHNTVYAFDADDPNANPPLWHVNLGTPVPSQDVCVGISNCFYEDLQPEVGITATPVIDPTTQTIYVVTHTKNTSNNTYHFFLHALDITSGADNFKTEITASGFKPLYQLNRPGLMLLNGIVYLAFGSAGDFGDWHGFVMAYDATTLAQLGVYNTTPENINFVKNETGGGGIFSCGQGLVTDGSNLYFFTGNGPFDVSTGGTDYGDTALKLTLPGLSVSDYFTPYDAASLGTTNTDLGAGGPLLLPNTSLLVGGGKDGYLHVLNTGNMGKFNTSDQDVQHWKATSAWIMGSPVYWNGPALGPTIYLWASGDRAKAWQFNGQIFNTTPASQSAMTSAFGESDTSPLSLSANGRQAGTGVLWAPVSLKGDPNKSTVPAILHAFDASNLGRELWSSQQNALRDGVGSFAKFNPPTVANGKVFLGTFSGQLQVYGLNPPPASGIHFVQVGSAVFSSATPVVAASYPSAESGGDLNVVAVGWADSSSTVQSVTDSQNNFYQLAGSLTQGNGLSQAIYYAKNIAGGSNTVTVTFNDGISGAKAPDVRLLEYSGADRNNPLDVTAGAHGYGTFASSGSTTTNAPNELIFGADLVGGITSGPGSPFTSRIITEPNSDLAEDRMVNVVDSYSASALISLNNWVMQMATFKAAASSASPMFQVIASGANTVEPGQSGTYSVSVTAQNGFKGTVSFSCSGLPLQAGCTFSPPSVSSSGSSTLTVTTGAGTPAGDYQVVITGTSGSLQDSSSVKLTISSGPQFTLAITPETASASSGQAAKYTVAVSGENGFSGNVALSCSSMPAQASCSFSPSSVASGGQSSLTVSVASATPPGNYGVTIVGRSGSLQAATSATLTVTATSSFTVAVSPRSATVTAGNSANYTISVAAQNGFNSAVALSCSGLPTGAACAFTPSSVPPDNQATLTITTTGASAQLMPPGRRHSHFPLYALGLLFPPLAVMSLTRGGRKRRQQLLLLGALALGLLGLQLSCSGAGTSTTTPPSGSTPSGTYTIQVIGTAPSLQRSTSVTLNVQ